MLRHIPAILALGLLASCDGSKTSPTMVSSVTVTAAAGATSVTFANRSQTAQLTATARLSDGTTSDVTATASWSSSSPATASVTGGGLVTALANGATTISATHLGQTGTLGATVAMRATAEVTPTFARLCSPFRAQMSVVIREASNNISFQITLLEITMTDINNVQRYHRALSVADIVAMIGTNVVGPGLSQTITVESAYPGNVDTQDSKGRVILTGVDAAGIPISVTLTNIVQRDRC